MTLLCTVLQRTASCVCQWLKIARVQAVIRLELLRIYHTIRVWELLGLKILGPTNSHSAGLQWVARVILQPFSQQPTNSNKPNPEPNHHPAGWAFWSRQSSLLQAIITTTFTIEALMVWLISMLTVWLVDLPIFYRANIKKFSSSPVRSACALPHDTYNTISESLSCGLCTTTRIKLVCCSIIGNWHHAHRHYHHA